MERIDRIKPHVAIQAAIHIEIAHKRHHILIERIAHPHSEQIVGIFTQQIGYIHRKSCVATLMCAGQA